TFDRDFKPYIYAFPLADSGQSVQPPPNYEDMVRTAETLAGGIDFIRVDMYNVRGRIFAGEFTVYPGGGFIRFLPHELDAALGAKWPSNEVP
ncbi:MAG: polysaccharide biosynthesis protein, partial [Acidobacteria bacterium]|nr:polysaccharide biosynthesis protein [Acidobacteriota bacterium]